MTMKPHETSKINIFTMENSQLQPQSVFHYFSIINKIPRPSGKEEQMMAYLHKFAKEHGLESMQDETGNVLIRKPATPGYENRKTTVLQSHMDMVCEKEAGLEFNFLTDPGGYMYFWRDNSDRRPFFQWFQCFPGLGKQKRKRFFP